MKKEEHTKAIVKRLKTAAGHIHAVSAMVEQNAYCMDIVNQNHAVIEALRKVNQLVLAGYLGECAVGALRGKTAAKRKAAITELMKIYSTK